MCHYLIVFFCVVVVAVEDEMKRTQINKATEGHLGRLKAKLAKLRTEVRDALLLQVLSLVIVDLFQW